jgi:hypothetical protein
MVDIDVVGLIGAGVIATSFAGVAFDADDDTAACGCDGGAFWDGKVDGIVGVAFVGCSTVVSLRDGDALSFFKGEIEPL